MIIPLDQASFYFTDSHMFYTQRQRLRRLQRHNWNQYSLEASGNPGWRREVIEHALGWRHPGFPAGHARTLFPVQARPVNHTSYSYHLNISYIGSSIAMHARVLRWNPSSEREKEGEGEKEWGTERREIVRIKQRQRRIDRSKNTWIDR